jgi:hypothetical protein
MARGPWFIRFAVIALGLVLLGVAVGFARGAVSDSRALSRSVDREVGAAFDGFCKGGDGGRWRCDVSDPSGSAEGHYRVSFDGDCWTARRGLLEPLTPERLHGCVAVRDRYPFIGNVFDAWELL